MEFKQEGVRFTVPDKITVRQQLAYFSTIAGIDQSERFERRWESAKTMIEEWECELIPDKDVSLDEMYSLDQTNILIWVGNQVVNYLNSLEETPKN
jgi:hypothetical protein